MLNITPINITNQAQICNLLTEQMKKSISDQIISTFIIGLAIGTIIGGITIWIIRRTKQ
jgi:NhaP-type Na+/H+ or K+/H+ antiporter